MKTNKLILWMTALTLTCASAAQTVDFVPRPVSVEYKEGKFLLDKNIRIEGGDAFTVQYLKDHLARVFNPVGDSWNPAPGAKITFVRVKSFPAEGYALDVRPDGIWLRPANPDFPSIKVDPESDFTIWGVVTYSIHKRR